MKAKKRMDALERFIMTALGKVDCQRRRIDELAARVADLERALLEMTERVEALAEAHASQGETVFSGESVTTTETWVTCPQCGQMVRFDDDAHVCFPPPAPKEYTVTWEGHVYKLTPTGCTAGHTGGTVPGECGLCGSVVHSGSWHVCNGTWGHSEASSPPLCRYNAGLAASGHENHPSTGVSAWDWECGVCGQHVSAGERHFCEGQERQRHHLAGWECGLCGRIIPAGARHLCSGLRGHDGIAKAAYEVVEER